MQVPWSIERCIVCLREPRENDPLSQLTDAHVIPKSVGGELSASFLCKRCNSEMGRVEGQLPRDILVVEAVRRLEGELPKDLVHGVLQHAGWFADTAEFGELEARASRTGDISLGESESIRTDANIRRQIQAELDRREVPLKEIEDKVTEFEQAPDGAELEIAPGFTVKKHIDLRGVSFERTYDEPLAPPAIALGIGYTFLALAIEEGIYRDELEPARDVLRRVVDRDTSAADAWPIDSRRASSTPETKHGLAVLREEGGAAVRIKLFRELVWIVHFSGVEPRIEPFYLLDLVTKEELVTP